VGLGQGTVEDLAVTVPDPCSWRGRSVLVTGHTGFKGAWLTLMLSQLGARVTGLALPPPPGPALFPLLAPGLALEHRTADLRDANAVTVVMR
jgi:CDP-glucose 4,6-dehydratase